MASGTAKVLEQSVAEAAAFAAGLAIGPVLAPIVRALENESWSQYPDMPVPAAAMARGVAEHKLTEATGEAEAKLTGFGPTAFATLVELVKSSPSISEALRLIQRGQMSAQDFPTILQRAGLEDAWAAAYQRLSSTGLGPWQEPLSPADIALGLIRNNLRPQEVDGQPMFPPGGSSAGSKVPHDPISGIDVLKEAEASGIDPERMAVLARNVGLPPGVIEGLNMLNRGIIDDASFYLLIEQSDARLAWGPFLYQLRRMILTPHNYAELHLRDWITQDERDAGAAMSGMEPADTQLLFDMLGRPLGIHQITTGIARGGVFQPGATGPQDPYDAYVHWSNLRPEFYELAKSNAYTYPSLLQLNTLVKNHAVNADTARDWARKAGYAPEVLDALHAYWLTLQPVAASSATKTATTAAVRAIQKAYVQEGLSQPTAQTELTNLGEDPSTFPALFQAWDVSRTAYLQGLSNAQVRNRFRNEQLTEAAAVAILTGRGLTATQAVTYLTAGTASQTPPAV